MIDSLLFLPGLALSDHICIQFTYTCYTKVTNNCAPRYNIDYDKLWNLLGNVNWDESIGNYRALDAWDHFSETFNRFLQQTVPISNTAKYRNKNI